MKISGTFSINKNLITLLGISFILISTGISQQKSKTMSESTSKDTESCSFDPKEEAKLSAGQISLTDAEWQKKLTPEQFRILRQKGTEAPGTGKYEHFKGNGMFVCAAC